MLTITDLYTARGLALKSKGRNSRGAEFAGPCPLCGGRDRFLVWPEQNDGQGSFSCRQCGISGDVIEWFMRVDGMTFQEAAKAAGRKLEGRPVKSAPRAPQKHEKEPARIEIGAEPEKAQNAAQWREEAAHFVETRHKAIWAQTEARRYLAGRGLDEVAVRDYRLGWQCGENGRGHIMRLRKKWGLPDEAAREPGGRARRAVWIPRGIVIPCPAADGGIERIRIRRPEADRKQALPNLKYYVMPGSGGSPLWLSMRPGIFRNSPACVVVEAELDAMLVHRAAGDICAALAVGTAHLRRLPAVLMDRLNCFPVILVAMDVDANGAGGKGWELWKATFSQAERWPCINGKDPGEMFQAAVPGHGYEDIREWVIAGLPPVYAEVARRVAKKESAFVPGQELPGVSAPLKPQPTPEPGRPSKPSRPEPNFPTHPVWDLNGYYMGKELVRECLRANGLTLVPVPGDVRIRGDRQLPKSEYVKLLPFLRRHREYIDEIAKEMGAES